MSAIEQYLETHQSDYIINDSGLLRDFAYDRLKDAIRYARVQPGEPLSETRLSKALGISRTPVREALHLLSQEGLVEMSPGRAITITSSTFKDVLDVLRIRSLLEPELTRLATESITPEQLDTLWKCLLLMEQAVENADRAAWSRADTGWHEVLSDACSNQLLGEIVLQMRNRIHRYANIDNELKLEQLRNGTAEHRVIVNAIASGDAVAAEKAMADHLDSLRTNLFDQLIYR
jgi:DNA-binding GntR family transcriptional regulator